MIIKCSCCGEEYDSERFPICPFCLRELDINAKEECVEDMSVVNTDDINKSDTLELIFELEKARNTEVEEIPDVEEISEVITDIELTEKKSVNINNLLIENVGGLSIRAFNCLKRNRIDTIGDLGLAIEEESLMRFRNLGKKTYKEIIEMYNRVVSENKYVEKEAFEKKVDSRVKIVDIYPHSYHLFLKYCEDNGIQYAEELKKFDFSELIVEYGFGEKKIEKLKTIFSEYYSNNQSLRRSLLKKDDNQEIMISVRKHIEIHEGLQDLRIEILILFGIPRGAINSLRTSGCTKFKHL